MKTAAPLILLVALPFTAWAQTPGPNSVPWTSHRLVIPAASRVDLSHLGAHTHADEILFQIGGAGAAVLRADSQAQNVRLVAHCRLPTSGSALPPGFGWLSNEYGAVPTYGPIDGDPGWALTAVPKGQGRSVVRVAVPTRFANWVAGQTAAMQRRYTSRGSYSLEISWEQQGANAGG